jgi:hypothetical protein
MAGGLDFHKRLGSGYFGEVWLATDTGLNAERAFKLIAPDKVDTSIYRVFCGV